jgi:hypothetical protein
VVLVARTQPKQANVAARIERTSDVQTRTGPVDLGSSRYGRVHAGKLRLNRRGPPNEPGRHTPATQISIIELMQWRHL